MTTDHPTPAAPEAGHRPGPHPAVDGSRTPPDVPRAAVVALWALAASAAVVGLWAQLAPASFYADFPAPGRLWVSVDGPYNEHLVRDVGGLHLALTAVTVAAALSRRPRAAVAAATAWLLYGAPHVAYHAGHLEGLTPLDAVGQITALSLQVAVPALLLGTAIARRGTAAG